MKKYSRSSCRLAFAGIRFIAQLLEDCMKKSLAKSTVTPGKALCCAEQIRKTLPRARRRLRLVVKQLKQDGAFSWSLNEADGLATISVAAAISTVTIATAVSAISISATVASATATSAATTTTATSASTASAATTA